MVFSCALVPLMLAAGVAVDYTHLSRADAHLTNVADAAALAGAKAMGVAFEQTDAEREVAAEAAAQDAIGGMVEVADAVIDVSVADSRVSVSLSRDEPLFFLHMIGQSTARVAGTSVAIYTPGEPHPCLLGLDTGAASGIAVSGSANINGAKCDFWSNSTSGTSLSFTGASQTTAEEICAVGGSTGNAPVSPTPETGCRAEPDPFADRDLTDTRACQYGPQSVPASQSATLEPGVYCGDLSLQGNVTLNPGLFVIRDGVFRINGSADLEGRGASVLLQGSSYLDWEGGAVVTISPMQTGELAGIVIASDPSGPAATSTIAGNLTQSFVVGLGGSFYLPNQTLAMTGSSQVSVGPEGGLVAGSFSFAGSATVNLEYDEEAVHAAALNTLHLKE